MPILLLQPDLTLPAQKPGMPLKDPFRTGLQQAVQWYSNLRTALQTKVEDALAAAESPAPISTPIQAAAESPAPTLEAADTSAASADTSAASADASATIEYPARANTPPPAMAPPSPYPPPSPLERQRPPDPLTDTAADTSALPADTSAPMAGAATDAGPSPEPPHLTPGWAARVLRERCPACFGLEQWGRPLEKWVYYYSHPT
jgi:hypothetical protein